MTRADIAHELFGATTGWAKSRILKSMIDAYPDPIATDAIVTAVYPARRMPADPAQNVRVMVAGIRRNIEPLGWTVSTNAGGTRSDGSGVAGRYALVRLS